jgi:hypothetical protein
MTFRELIAAHPDLFYSQAWYAGEAFLDWPCSHPIRLPGFVSCPNPPDEPNELPSACMLAELFVRYPHAAVWRNYFWTSSRDHLGQRVYVGGSTDDNGYRLEIHRHLHLTPRWGCPTW